MRFKRRSFKRRSFGKKKRFVKRKKNYYVSRGGIRL